MTNDKEAVTSQPKTEGASAPPSQSDATVNAVALKLPSLWTEDVDG